MKRFECTLSAWDGTRLTTIREADTMQEAAENNLKKGWHEACTINKTPYENTYIGFVGTSQWAEVTVREIE